MTTDPNRSQLDNEIDAALDGVNLQEVADRNEDSAGGSASGAGRDGLMEGRVAGVHADDVIVELGPRMQGVASIREFDDPPQVGDRHRFLLRGREDGLWILSLREAQAIAAWADLEEGSLVKARVTAQTRADWN